jgi:phosphoglycolate phosphatase
LRPLDSPKRVDLIAFDLDGTLIDSARDISFCVNETLRCVGRPALPEATIHAFVGRGVLPLIERSLDEASPRGKRRGPETEEAVRLFMELYAEHCLDHTRLYPGIREVLDVYAEKSLAVVTNKAERFSLKILDGLGVRDRFKAVLGGDSTKERKPHPEPILKLLEATGLPARSAVTIGDSAIDIAAGKAAGTWTCGVLYGFRPESEVREAAPDAVVSTALESPRRFI